MPNNWQQYTQVIVLALVFAISAIGWLIRTLSEQRALKRARESELRRREEIRRTGRDDAGNFVDITRIDGQQAAPLPSQQPSPDDVKRRLQELAERRRAELAEIVRRQQVGEPAIPSAAPRRPQPPPVQPPVLPTAQPRPVQVPPNKQPQQRQPSPRPQPAPSFGPGNQRPQRSGVSAEADEQLRQRRQRERAERAKADAARQRAEAQEAADVRAEKAERAARQSPQRAPSQQRTSSVAERTTDPADTLGSGTQRLAQRLGLSGAGAQVETGEIPAAEWRRAIIMLEILNKPASQRELEERVL